MNATFKGILNGEEVFVQVTDLNEFINAPAKSEVWYTTSNGCQGSARKSAIQWERVY